MKAERVRFTRAELEVVNDMCAIATAAPWGEGGYRTWDHARHKHFQSLRDKVWRLMDRLPQAAGQEEA